MKKGGRLSVVSSRRFLFIFLMIFLFGVVLAGSFLDSSSQDFDLGVYSNTYYNGSAVVLFGSNTTGSYTSQVFDSGNISSWDNISYDSDSFGELDSGILGNVLLLHMDF
jgi:hypothetical protein